MTANLKDHINEVNVFWGDVEKDGTRMTKVTYKSPPKPINSGGNWVVILERLFLV